MWKTLLMAAALLAGCAGPAPTLAADPAPGAGSGGNETASFGELAVIVVTPQVAPIAGALVTVAQQERTTGRDGMALFEQIPAGGHVVEVREPAHGTSSAAVVVEAGQRATLNVKLVSTSIGSPPPAEDKPQQFRLNGFFDCSATYLIITGDCMTALDHVVTSATGSCSPVCPGDLTEEEHVLEFPLHANWTTIVAEMHWDAGTTAGQRMTFAVEPAEAPADGHAAKYARTAGTSPLVLRVDNSVPHPSASLSADGEAPDMPQAAGGEVLRTRSYVQGEAHNPGGTNFLGVGVALQQEFDVIVTVFYGDPAPDGYAAG